MATADSKTNDASKELTVVTPEFRVSFPHVFEPDAMDDKQEKKYSVAMLFPKDVNLDVLKSAARKAVETKWPDVAKRPKTLKSPFSDGDEKDYDGYKGMIVVKASSTKKPFLCDRKREQIVDEGVFYAGCYARAQVYAHAYDMSGSRGVTFILKMLQKTNDGEAFGAGSGNPDEVFGDLPAESGSSAADNIFA